MTRPWLSVITPTYNGAAYLAATLDSILMQRDSQIECIAVDGGSSDETLSIIQSYQRQLPMQVVERASPSSWMTSSNHGLSLAGGEYICFLHQDDLWYAGRLPAMKRLAQQFPDAPLLLHASNYIDRNGRFLGRWSCPLPDAPRIVTRDLMVERLLVQNFISMPGPVIRKDVALEVGGLDENLWYTADWDFWLKVAARGATLYDSRSLSAFRVHSGSQTILRSADLADRRAQLDTVLEKHLANWEAPERLKRQVRRTARFSNDVNVSLAGAINGARSQLPGLLIEFLRLGPSSGNRYLRDSRVWERVTARLRGQLLTGPRRRASQTARVTE